MRVFKIYVYNNHGHSNNGELCFNNPLAYITYYSPPRVCVHNIEAENGIKAKRLAIKEHKYSGKCNQQDSYCPHHPFCKIKQEIKL